MWFGAQLLEFFFRAAAFVSISRYFVRGLEILFFEYLNSGVMPVDWPLSELVELVFCEFFAAP